ncbi:MAG: exodeoxyribonuclease VII small subunit [bacterium]
MAETAKELGFEESLERLEKIVALLERGEAPLEGTIELFEEGIRLSRRCHELLTVAEERVQKLVRQKGGRLALEPFPDEDDERG